MVPYIHVQGQFISYRNATTPAIIATTTAAPTNITSNVNFFLKTLLVTSMVLIANGSILKKFRSVSIDKMGQSSSAHKLFDKTIHGADC